MPLSQPLEVAVTAWMFGTGGTAQALAEQAVIAEELQYHSFWLPESHFTGDASIPSPLMNLAAVASQTSRLKLGSTSYLLPIRHPLQAAEEVAVLDRLSAGRVILGVGRGFRDGLFTVFDVPPAEKRKRFAAALEAMLAAWKGQPIGVEKGADGEEQPVYLGPQPVQKPHPPIWVAAFGPLAIKQAATLGLPYLASPMESEAALTDNYRRHRQLAEAAGHPPIDAVPVMRTVYVSDDRSQNAAIKEALGAQGRGSLRADQPVTVDEWALIGDAAFVADGLARYREVLGMTLVVARGRIPGVSNADHIRSMESIARIAQDIA